MTETDSQEKYAKQIRELEEKRNNLLQGIDCDITGVTEAVDVDLEIGRGNAVHNADRERSGEGGIDMERSGEGGGSGAPAAWSSGEMGGCDGGGGAGCERGGGGKDVGNVGGGGRKRDRAAITPDVQVCVCSFVCVCV